MRKSEGARQLAIDILARSTCQVQVGAAIEDKRGILSWGWNSIGLGYGIHAEIHAILRANRKRLTGATIYVASRRLKHGKPVTSKPCVECQKLIDKWELSVMWRNNEGEWQEA